MLRLTSTKIYGQLIPVLALRLKLYLPRYSTVYPQLKNGDHLLSGRYVIQTRGNKVGNPTIWTTPAQQVFTSLHSQNPTKVQELIILTKMIAKTQDYAGKPKRTKPRRQSGSAVSAMQKFGSLERLAEYQIENCDQDLQRMRRKFLLLDIENILRNTNSVRAEDTSRASSSTGESTWGTDGSSQAIHARRSKPRRQSGSAVDHLNGICQESLEVARAAARLEELDADLAPKPKQRRASAPPTLPPLWE